MIAELRRSAFDTDLLLYDHSCQDLNVRMSSENANEMKTISTLNQRRAEALQRDYERLGFQVNRLFFLLFTTFLLNHQNLLFKDVREPIKDFQNVPPGILSLQNLFYFCIHQKNDFIRVYFILFFFITCRIIFIFI